MDKVTVYIVLAKEQRTCEYGDKHNVSICTRKFLYPTGETWIHNNGYEKNQLPVYKDAQGRKWYKHQTIDYSNNTYYVTKGLANNVMAYPRMPYNGVMV